MQILVDEIATGWGIWRETGRISWFNLLNELGII